MPTETARRDARRDAADNDAELRELADAQHDDGER